MTKMINKEQALSLFQSLTTEYALSALNDTVKEMHSVQNMTDSLNEMSKMLNKKDESGDIIVYKII